MKITNEKGKMHVFGFDDIGIDLGTATVLIYVKGKGIVLREPSVVAIDRNTNQLLAVGDDARNMIGKTPGNIVAVRPLRDGVISDYDVTERMLRYFLKKIRKSIVFWPRIVVCVPSGVTEVEKRAVLNAADEAGARHTYLIEEPIAAAIGAGIDIGKASGNMVVDIGGGTTDIAVISLGGAVISDSIKVAGDKFDEAIVRYVRKKHNLLIGERTAEQLKINIGAAYKGRDAASMSITGRSLISGLPKSIKVTTDEIIEALEEPVQQIGEAVHSVLERTPPELSADISDKGIVMTGGGSLLNGLDRMIMDKTKIKCTVVEDAVSCVALGTGKALEDISYYKEGAISDYSSK